MEPTRLTDLADANDVAIEATIKKYVAWETLPKNHFISVVEKGRQGLNVGLDNGMPGMSKYLYGTQPGRYYLLGADSGVGKTTIADFMFVLQLMAACRAQGRKLYLFYYSFEISRVNKEARWASFFLKMLYGIDLPADYLVGNIPGRTVSDEQMEKVRYAYRLVEDIFKEITFIEDPVHPTRIFNNLIDHHYEKIGVVTRGPQHDPKRKGPITSYTPNDERAVTLLIVDHIALTHSEKAMDTKGTIDLLSKYLVILRNLFGLTCCVIQQFNTELMSYHRMNKKGDGIIAPQRLDFGDSKYTYRDADVVLGFLKPAIYDVPKYMKYDITKLGRYFIAAHLMKNRYGSSNHVLPLFLNPVSGIPEDLPLMPEFDLEMDPYYKKAEKLESLCQSFSPVHPSKPQD
jgi:hypothetical protein